jgi:hypothetical protein
MTYKKELEKEQDRRDEFLHTGKIEGDEERYTEYLKSRHHHEILPERFFLIGRIQKAFEKDEKDFYIKRYSILQAMHPNHSWDEYVEKL